MRHTRAIGAAVLTLVTLTTEVRAQAGYFEMRCRGGENLFVLDGPEVTGSDTLALNFSSSSRAAGADGSGLDPGTCAWLDRPFRELEPYQIQFTTPGPVGVIREHLNDSTRYWSFWVSNTDRGYYQTSRHGPWTPAKRPIEQTEAPPIADALPSGGSAPPPIDPRTRVPHDVVLVDSVSKAGGGPVDPNPARTQLPQPIVATGIGTTTVTPILHGVNIAFKAPRGVAATVAIGTGKATTPVLGKPLRLPNTIAEVPALQLSKSAGPMAEFLVSYSRLEQGQTYSYLITVPDHAGGPPSQKSGTFTTLGQRARVVFTYIHVLSDSDEDGPGDLTFELRVNPDEVTHQIAYLGSFGDELEWESGIRRRINTELVVENAPDRLRILVLGEDDDHSVIDSRRLPYERFTFETAVPGFTNSIEWNFARGEFDLLTIPTKGGSIPFTLRSLPSKHPRHSLAFEVSGYIELTRP